MIPKTIHYIWFGGSPLGEKEKACLDSWKRSCPDYEIVRWDESNFDVNQNKYCREAYAAKKWAFVSDYVRLWVLVNHGGIYMDTDVEVVKALDRFLGHDAFSGFESDGNIPTGIMASKKGFPLFAKLLDDYSDRSFLLENGEYDMTTNVVLITDACRNFGFTPNNEYQVIDGLALYPKDWFCPKDWETGAIEQTENTHTIHHFAGSWLSPVAQDVRRKTCELIEKYPGISSKWARRFAKVSCELENGGLSSLIKAIKNRIRS